MTIILLALLKILLFLAGAGLLIFWLLHRKITRRLENHLSNLGSGRLFGFLMHYLYGGAQSRVSAYFRLLLYLWLVGFITLLAIQYYFT